MATHQAEHPVQDYPFEKILKHPSPFQALLTSMGNAGGFTATKFAKAARIAKKIVSQQPKEGLLRWTSFPACLCATGSRSFFVELLAREGTDVVVTTCGTLDHDIARTLGAYDHGSFDLDDSELAERGLSRLGNVIVPQDTYGNAIEKFMTELIAKHLCTEKKRKWTGIELVWAIGKQLNDEKSICTQAWKKKIPIIIPGLVDGAVGAQLIQAAQDTPTIFPDLLADQMHLSNLTWTSTNSEAILIGGGISKHHVMWWNQYRGGLDRAIAITTAPEWDGSLSGARLKEAISWGKLKSDATEIVVEGEASLLLPLLGCMIF